MIAAGLMVVAITLSGAGAIGADADEAPLWRGQWDTVEEMTIEPRTGAAVAVAPGRPHGVVVWGGVAEDGRLLNDGVLIDSVQPSRWRVMPESPLAARRDFGWARWADRVYIWGGVDQAGAPLGDGAEYGHGWTRMPESPLPPGPAAMAVVDDRLWVVATDPDSGAARIASIAFPMDRTRDWGRVADVPLPVGERYAVVGCCDFEPQSVVVYSLRSDGFATAASWDIGDVRPSTGGVGREWTQLGTVPVPPLPLAGPVTGSALEQDLAAWAGASDEAWPGTDASGAFGVLQPLGFRAGGSTLTPPVSAGIGSDAALVLSPRHLISVSDLAAYDLAEERWLRLPERHRSPRFGTPTGATAWWDRGRLWVIGGVAPDGTMRSDLWTFTPRLPRGTYRLPGGWATLFRGQDGECYFIGSPGTWRLRGDERARPRVWMQKGRRQEPLKMPDGWHASFAPRLTITDPGGTVRYRKGDSCQGTTGTGG